MRALLALLVALALVGSDTLRAQPGLELPESGNDPIRIGIDALVQRYSVESDRSIRQTSFPVSVFVPVGRFGLSLRAARTSVSGDAIEGISGFADTQVAASYYQPTGGGSLVASLAANLPTGSTALPADEFSTALLLSQSRFRFGVPSVGQGFTFAPSLTFAYAPAPEVAVGFGVGYHLRGGYQPLASVADTYNPGNEIVLTGGFDSRLGRSGAFSADVSYAFYGADQWGGVSYEAGNQLAATVQLLAVAGSQEFLALARYRNRGGSALADSTAGEATAAVPRQAELLLRPKFRFAEEVAIALSAGVRYFGTSAFFDQQLLFDAGVAPEFDVTPQVRVIGRFVYTFSLQDVAAEAGTDPLSGFAAGGGLRISL